MWVEFVVCSLPCSERFFSGYSGFPLPSKTNTSNFQFDQDQNHFVDVPPPNHYLFIYLLCFRFAALRPDPIPSADLQIIDHPTRLSDNPRPSEPTLDQTTTDPRQTRPPNQITPPDHRPPALTTRPPISTAYQTL